jgi:hypothetical protein
MIMDNLLMLDGSFSSAGQYSGTPVNSGVTFKTGNQPSANCIDISNIATSALGRGLDFGIGRDLLLYCLVTAAFTGSSSTLQVQLQYAPDNGSGMPGTWQTVAQSVAYTLAQLAQGAELLRVDLPAMSPSSVTPKFIQMNYVVGVANMTAGAIMSAVALKRQALGPYLSYPAGSVGSNPYM